MVQRQGWAGASSGVDVTSRDEVVDAQLPSNVDGHLDASSVEGGPGPVGYPGHHGEVGHHRGHVDQGLAPHGFGELISSGGQLVAPGPGGVDEVDKQLPVGNPGPAGQLTRRDLSVDVGATQTEQQGMGRRSIETLVDERCLGRHQLDLSPIDGVPPPVQVPHERTGR